MVHMNVEKVRVAKGVTKTFLARKLKLSLQGYRHLASGNVKLDTERLKIIALALDEEVAVFFDDQLTESVITRLCKNITSKEAV